MRDGNASDLLIGGLGADLLHGNAGDDLLIGGITDFDTNFTALDAIMDEWRRSDVDLTTRVNHLNGSLSGGQNAGYYLTARTDHDDAAIDTLFGDAGSDWFFYLASGPFKDKLKDNGLGDIGTSL